MTDAEATADGETEKPKRHVKVLKLRILKPSGAMTWKELGSALRETRYRVFRLANLAVSENYLEFHKKRTNDPSEKIRPSKLNKDLAAMLDEERKKKPSQIPNILFSKEGALPDTVTGALFMYKLRSATGGSKWGDIVKGKSSLPSFRLDMPIPVRCDQPVQKRMERTSGGDVEVDLMICLKPYPRVVLATGDKSLGDGAKAVLDRLLENVKQSPNGYRQRCFEIKEKDGKWFLLVTYDFPHVPVNLKTNIVVGVDIGVSCPIYAAINNGHARLGWRQFGAIGARIMAMRNQLIKRRREIQRGGNAITGEQSARSGHGRKRKLAPIEKLQGKIDRAYQTLNHQMSSAVIKFAQDHGAGLIQMEDLGSLHEALSGTFLGERWQYAPLQGFIAYKAKEAGIETFKVNPRFTSRRCSKCGYINMEFSHEYRVKNKNPKFKCADEKCGLESDPDYNAAINIATIDIGAKIVEQCKQQGIKD